MIYTEAAKKAMKLCFKAHKDPVDKSGLPQGNATNPNPF